MNKYFNKAGEDGDNMNNKGDIEREVAGVCIRKGLSLLPLVRTMRLSGLGVS